MLYTCVNLPHLQGPGVSFKILVVIAGTIPMSSVWTSQCLPAPCHWKVLPASLLHPGDPLRFHAHYIAQCWAPGDPIPLQDLVSAGRLGTSVRKTLLLCSPQPDGKVVYTSLQWASLQ